MAKSTASRVPTTITTDAQGNAAVRPSQTFAPMRAQVFKDDQITDGKMLARMLNTMQQVINDATLAARSNNRNLSQTFENITVDAASTTPISLSHNFGTKVRWSVVRWAQPKTGAVTTCGLYEATDSQQNPNILVLSVVAGTLGVADVEVWSA